MNTKKNASPEIPLPQPWLPYQIQPGSYLDPARLQRQVQGKMTFAQRIFPRLVDFVGPLYVKTALKTWPVEIRGLEHILELKKRQSNLDPGIIAFRHPGDADPHLVYYALSSMIKGRMKCHYFSGADLIMWGNSLVEWALGAAATIPLRHGGGDARLLDQVMDQAAREGSALVLAPEGQVAYHCQAVPDMDPGAAWLALRLQDKAGPDRRVGILPLHLQYLYPRETWKRLDRFVSRLEALAGLGSHNGTRPGEAGNAGLPGRASRQSAAGDDATGTTRTTGTIGTIGPDLAPLADGTYFPASLACPASNPDKDRLAGLTCAPVLRQRLFQVWHQLLTKGESLYGLVTEEFDSARLKVRSMNLAEAAMEKVEKAGRGREGTSLKSRIVNMRTRFMDTILDDPASPPLDRAIRRCTMEETFWLQRHLERADLLEYLDPAYLEGTVEWLAGTEGFTRLIETAQNLWDLAMRLAGGSIGSRARFFRSRLLIAAGPILGVAQAEKNKAGPKARLSDLMDRLARSYSDLMASNRP